MPRAPSEKAVEAEKLFKQGMAMVDIGKKLGISPGTIRSWKNRYGWDLKTSKKNKCNVAKKSDKKSATLQKKKRGGQPGNQNAKGGSGNPHPSKKIAPDAALKHGVYSAVIMDALDDDERELLEYVSTDEEQLLIEEIQLYTLRERKILKAMKKYREQKGDVTVADVTRIEQKRNFDNEEDKAEYERRVKEKIDKGDRLPGNSYSISTHTTNKDMIIARWEQELSSVQSKKTKAIEALSKHRLEKRKIENEDSGQEIVDDWISAVVEGAEGI